MPNPTVCVVEAELKSSGRGVDSGLGDIAARDRFFAFASGVCTSMLARSYTFYHFLRPIFYNFRVCQIDIFDSPERTGLSASQL